MNEASQRRLKLVTDAAFSQDLAAQRRADLSPEEATDLPVDEAPAPSALVTPAANSALLRVRNRWSTPPMVALRVAFAMLALALVAVVSIALSRPSGAPGEEPDLAWPDPPPDWIDDGGAQADRAGDGGLAGADEGGTRPANAGADALAGVDDDEGHPQQHPDGSVTVAEEQAVVVHVAGQVQEPGVVELPAGSRVHEALDAAGGPTSQAALEAVNLAATLIDGQQLYVPAVGEEPREPVSTDAGQEATGPGPDPGRADQDGQPALVDLNSADETTLQSLPGIGPAMSARIIEHRTANGQFTSVDQLSAVSGIGPATLARLRDLVTV